MDFFDAKYVITLARRSDRLEAFRNRWLAVGLDWDIETVTGVDGETCRPPEWWTAGNGAWGCYRSHVRAIENALNEKRRNVLIFEDDAVFCEDFSTRINEVISELPEDWDFLYLGGQHTHESEKCPTKLVSHIARAYSVNRNHAYSVNGKALEKVYRHLNEFQNWEKSQHIDHHLEKLHRSGEFNVYCAVPFIVFQAAGKSDINGKTLPERSWNIAGIFKEAKKVNGITVETLRVGWGQPKTDGTLGYAGELQPPNGLSGYTIISAHAPSVLKISVPEKRKAIAFQNGDMSAPEGCEVFVDGSGLGKISKAGDLVEFGLDEGSHTLEFRTKDNRACHTLWAFSEKVDETQETQTEATHEEAAKKPRKRKNKTE